MLFSISKYQNLKPYSTLHDTTNTIKFHSFLPSPPQTGSRDNESRKKSTTNNKITNSLKRKGDKKRIIKILKSISDSLGGWGKEKGMLPKPTFHSNCLKT